VVSLLGHFTPRKEPLVLVKWGAEWASELVRTFLEKRKIINGCDGILQLIKYSHNPGDNSCAAAK